MNDETEARTDRRSAGLAFQALRPSEYLGGKPQAQNRALRYGAAEAGGIGRTGLAYIKWLPAFRQGEEQAKEGVPSPPVKIVPNEAEKLFRINKTGQKKGENEAERS